MQEKITIPERESVQAELGGIIISALKTLPDSAKIVVGCPGLPNITEDLIIGGAILFETPDGLFEVRVMKSTGINVTVLLSHVAPRPGIRGGFIEQEQDNAPFTIDELTRIKSSLANVKGELAYRSDITSEQLDFIERKLDEMQAASERMGRKDWINLSLGMLTSIVATLALEPTTAKALFQIVSDALSWLVGAGIKLLPG